MKRYILYVLIVSLVLSSMAAYAVPPAYIGPMGNLEEPAMRPYKWLWFGIKKLWQRPLQAIRRGDEKVPFFGALEVTRGAERGVIELTESVYHGMVFAPPPNKRTYRNAGSVNAFIESDWLFTRVADAVAVTPVIVDVLEHIPLRSEEDMKKLQVRLLDDAFGPVTVRHLDTEGAVTVPPPQTYLLEDIEPQLLPTETAEPEAEVPICPPDVHILVPSASHRGVLQMPAPDDVLICPVPQR